MEKRGMSAMCSLSLSKSMGVIFLTAFILILNTTAFAALIDHGDYFEDTNTGLYWYENTYAFEGGWVESKSEVEALTTGGFTWELPFLVDLQLLHSTYGTEALIDLNGASFITVEGFGGTGVFQSMGWLADTIIHTFGQDVSISHNYATMETESDGSYNPIIEIGSTGGSWYGAFAISTPVPEPATMLLLGLGLLGLAGVNRRKK